MKVGARLPLAVAAVVIALLSVAAMAPAAHAGTLELTSCSYYGDYALTTSDDIGATWVGSGDTEYAETNACPQGRKFKILANKSTLGNTDGQWSTTTPTAIDLKSVVTPAQEVLINPEVHTGGYRARYLWDDGSLAITSTGNCCGGMDYGTTIDHGIDGHSFAIQVYCPDGQTCQWPGNQNELLDIGGVALFATDDTPPVLTALGSDNLWYEGGGYVRGSWPIDFKAAADDGICHVWAVVDGQTLQGPTAAPNPHTWTQCPDPQTWHDTVDTSAYPNGSLALKLAATDAASPANVSAPSETLHVDNAPVTLSLSGPGDWLSTAGTAEVTANATAGPSGVGISCSLDGAPYDYVAGASRQISVQGIGPHIVRCQAHNNALDGSGDPAFSSTESWSFDIRQPTALAGPLFSRRVDGPRCRRVSEWVEVPAKWVIVKRPGNKLLWVHRKAHAEKVRKTRCHPRVTSERVAIWVTVRRHGKRVQVKKTKLVHVVVLPHEVTQQTRRVAHGAGATVSGWLGSAGGSAVAGARVRVLTAPEDGFGHFTQAALVTTAANGTWSAKLPAGPSRLVEAAYVGSSTLEPASSGQAHLVVPAKVELISVTPRRVAWDSRVRIVGQLVGGYLPSGGALVRLRIGFGSSDITYGVQEHVTGKGRFTTTYKFGAGSPGVVRDMWFELASLPMGNYPWAPAASGRRFVLVGGRPSDRRR